MKLHGHWPLLAHLEDLASAIIADALFLVVGMPLPSAVVAHDADDQPIAWQIDDPDLEVRPGCLAEDLIAEHLKPGLVSIYLFNAVVFGIVLGKEGIGLVNGNINLRTK